MAILVWTFVIVGLALICTLLVVLLFGPSPGWKDGIIGKMYDFLMNDAWTLFLKKMESWFGKNVAKRCEQLATRTFSTAHPALQIFYLLILTTALSLFFARGYPKLPNDLVGPVQTYFLIPAIILTTYYSFYKCSTTDPGIITSDNVDSALAMYPFDYVLYAPKQCKTCRLTKPARSKHCGLCKGCVAKQDHHCGWVNNCIGQQNHHWFLLFLFQTALVCGYGVFVLFSILYTEIDRLQLKRRMFVEDSGARRPSTAYDRWMYMALTESVVASLLFFGALCLAILGGFLFFQISLVGQNVTTNETGKWEDLSAVFEQGRQLVIRRPKDLTKTPKEDEDWEQIRVESYDDLQNIYRGSWWQNIKSVLFPQKLESKSKKS